MRRIFRLSLFILLLPTGLFAGEELEHAPREVSINFHINALNGINDREETFRADFYVIYQWTDPALNGKTQEDIDWSKVWLPNIECVNSDSFEKQYQDIFELAGQGRVKLTQRYKGVFKASFDLRKFPFDKQIFPIILESSTHMRDSLVLRYHFRKEKDKPATSEAHDSYVDSDRHVDRNVELAEWQVKSLKVIEKTNYYSFDSTYWSQFRIEIDMSRKFGFYLWNIVMVIFFIVFFAWCILFLDPEKLSDRLRAILSLLLSAIAFSFVTTTMLPKIPYLTLLDYFMKTSYVLLVLVVIESLYVHYVSKTGEQGYSVATRIDRYTKIVFPVLFIIMFLVIWFVQT